MDKLVLSDLLRQGKFEPPSFLRAAHYFSDGWPLDSLQVMRMPNVRRELRLLRRDGFNTMILVVPWRSFQTSQKPVEYDEFHQSQLRLVLREAQRAGLAVLLRVAYTHQVLLAPQMNGISYAQELLRSSELLAAWLDYHSEIASIAADYSCCIGGFVSWEELWHAFRFWQTGDERKRIEAAKTSGYLEYLDSKGVSGQSCVPTPDSAEHADFLNFANTRIREMFVLAQQRWSQLGVEYRVDKDPVSSEEGTLWRDNDQFFDWEPRRYSYWAPFMGAANVGEELSAEQAEGLLRHMLEATSKGGKSPGQILEQFNFVDNTQKYIGSHARIAEDQIAPFLQLAAPLLRTLSGGYGLWACRDYRMNVLYNTAFLASGRGWQLQGSSRLRPSGGVLMGRESTLRQRIKPRVSWVQRNHPSTEFVLEVEFARWRGLGAADLHARLNGGAWAPLDALAKGRLSTRVSADFRDVFDNGIQFELKNKGRSLSVSRVFLYYETYVAGVRDANAAPGPYLEMVQQFNQPQG